MNFKAAKKIVYFSHHRYINDLTRIENWLKNQQKIDSTSSKDNYIAKPQMSNTIMPR